MKEAEDLERLIPYIRACSKIFTEELAVKYCYNRVS